MLPKSKKGGGKMRKIPGARTDLADEAFDGLDGAQMGDERVVEALSGQVRVSRLRIVTDAASERLGRGRGEYVTVSVRSLSECEDEDLPELSSIVAEELLGLCPRPRGGVLVVGLGNRELTADAVGPLTALRVPATRHLAGRSGGLFEAVGYREISVIAPGAAGQTGIETGELVRLICASVRPALVIAVDALAARSCRRLGTTVQLSDAGITPGSGVGNARSELSRKTLGVPVISVGVPTVVSASVLLFDALAEAGLDPDADAYEVLLEREKDFFVTPKDCDLISDRAARVIAGAITEAYSMK